MKPAQPIEIPAESKPETLVMDDVPPEQLARCLFHESHDALFVIQPSTRNIVDVNAMAQRLTGHGRTSLLTMSLDDLISGEDQNANLKVACQLKKILQLQEGYCMNRRDAAPLAVQVSVSWLQGKSRLLGLVVVRDVSQQRVAEEGLLQANQDLEKALIDVEQCHAELVKRQRLSAVGEMACGLAHDLNNLLTPVVVYADLLRSQQQLTSNFMNQLRLISTAASDATVIVKKMQLSYCSSDTEVSTENIDLKELVQRIPDLTRPKWRYEPGRAGMKIDFHLDLDEDAIVQGRSSELRQVFTNLVFNAVDAMPAGGCISMRLRTADDFAIVEVCDTGVGMTDQQLASCTQPFYTTKGHGAGLGLSITRGIVERHGGRLEIESKHGGGSLVRISIPHDRKHKQTSKPVQPNVSNVKGLQVLFIDEEPMVRDSMAALLVAIGIQVDLAEGGNDGITMLYDKTYDVVITDLGMTGMDGREVTQAVKTRFPKIPVVLVSGWNEFRVRQVFDDLVKPDAIIEKPATKANLLRALEGLQLHADS